MLANANDTATVLPVVGREPPAMEWLIATGVVDRDLLQAMAAIKRRRFVQTAMEVQQGPTGKISGHIVWQVKLEEGNTRQGGT